MIPNFKKIMNVLCSDVTEALVAYQLIVTDDNGNTSVVVEKLDGKISITPGTEAMFAEATRTDSHLEEINALASRVITQADVEAFGTNLQRYVGMTIEQAMIIYRELGINNNHK